MRRRALPGIAVVGTALVSSCAPAQAQVLKEWEAGAATEARPTK